jgi:hypothetical protein
MPFHTTAKGQIQPCGASARACPLAPAEEYYSNLREANHALTMEALERQTDFLLELPADWGKVVPAVREQRVTPTPTPKAASSLSIEDFAAFKTSAANRPTQVRDDWREKLASDAQTNGDAYADANPNTDVVFGGYYDPEVD